MAKTNPMQFHAFQDFDTGKPCIDKITDAALGAFTKSGVYRCMVAEVNFMACHVHKGVTLDRPGVTPFILLRVELIGDEELDDPVYIATDMQKWCKVVSLPEAIDYSSADHPYIGSFSIRPKDVRSVNQPSRLSIADRDLIQAHLATSELLHDR